MFWGLGHQIPNFDGYVYIHYAAPSYSARISAIYPTVWQRLVGFGFRVQRVGSTMQNLRREGENTDPISIKPFLLPNFTEMDQAVPLQASEVEDFADKQACIITWAQNA